MAKAELAKAELVRAERRLIGEVWEPEVAVINP
jgi:hypothetical protein